MAQQAGPIPIPPVGEESAAVKRPKSEQLQSLDSKDLACLIINKMIGTGIYVTPATVALLVNNKYIALFLWVIGGLYSYLSIYIYLEYGIAWPYNGGEFFYVTKIFPCPPIIASISFAWVFVFFSTPVGNALNFSKFLLLSRNPNNKNPDEWLEKFIACSIVVAILLLHYRLVNIGVKANLWLAAGKTLFLSILVLAGFIGTCRDGPRNKLEGLHDWSKGWDRPKNREESSRIDVVVAMLLIFFSYQGWENANFVTSEIKGNAIERKRRLKRGALSAITIVTVLYILFNFFLFFLLSFKEIKQYESTVAAGFAIKVFRGKRDITSRAIYTCITLSACGNLIGVTFTNIRVKRDIAKRGLIPFHSFFSKSSKYGQSAYDELGTPTGGIVLHALVTCIAIAATRFIFNSSEGQIFMMNLYTYAHSMMSCSLGFGLFKLKKRMAENQTFDADEAGSDTIAPGKDYEYQMIKTKKKRWIMGSLLICVNGFITFAPLSNSSNPDGTRRKIKSQLLPAVVWSMYALGALAGLYILCFSTRFEFKNSVGNTRELGFLRYDLRRWVFTLPKMTSLSWKSLITVFTPQPMDEIIRRWSQNGEAETADALRIEFGAYEQRNEFDNDPKGKLLPQQQKLRRRRQEELAKLRERRQWMREKNAREMQRVVSPGRYNRIEGPSFSNADENV